MLYHPSSQVVAIDYPAAHYINTTWDGQISDLYPGIEMGMGYNPGVEAALADDCCPCECNCDIFTERFLPRTGASDPTNIEFDRKDTRVWTNSGGISLGVRSYPVDPGNISYTPTGNCAIFSSGGGNLRCETKPIRGNDFCVGINFNFELDTSGQQIAIKYAGLEAVVTLVRYTSGAAVGYKLQGNLTGAVNMVEYDFGFGGGFSGLVFNAALFIKDGYASLVVASRDNIINTCYQGPWPVVDTTRVTSGITSFSTVNPAQDFVSVEGRSLAGELRLFVFNIQNHKSDIKYRCQQRLFGTEDAVTDFFPSGKYQLDFHYGAAGLDFTVNTDFGLSKNTIVGYPAFGGGGQQPASQMRYTGNADGVFVGTSLDPGVGNPTDVKVEIAFTGAPEYRDFSFLGNIFQYSLGVGAMVKLTRFVTAGFGGGGYATTEFLSGPGSFGDNAIKWYGASRSMSAVRLYPPGSFVLYPIYNPASTVWVDVTAI